MKKWLLESVPAYPRWAVIYTHTSREEITDKRTIYVSARSRDDALRVAGIHFGVDVDDSTAMINFKWDCVAIRADL